MGASHDTYVFYGVHVPDEALPAPDPEDSRWVETDRIDELIHSSGESWTGFSHVTVNDSSMLFLAVDLVPDELFEVPLGKFRRLPRDRSHRMRKADDLLKRAVTLLCYDVLALDEPSWIVVRDYS